MQTIRKNLALFAGGLILATLIFANGATLFAAEVPAPPEPTDCTECQTIQDDLDAAYANFEALETQAQNYSADMEALIERGTTNIYGGDVAMMVDNLNAQVTEDSLAMGSVCQDSANTFAYYSSFQYDGTTYCFLDESMWYGVEPDYFNFFDHMMYLNEFWDPAAIPDWQLLKDEWIEVLMDHDGDEVPGLTEIIDAIIGLIASLEVCEETYCAEPVCPDCETIAGDLALGLDDLALMEQEADDLDAELLNLEAQIEEVWDQLDQLEQLRNELRQMVLDAGGMTDSDCDGFEPESGQVWGIAHNFGDVQWCFTSEGQIEEMIQNLDEYWETNSSTHLPTEAELNEQMDTLMNDYFDKLDEYDAVLNDIEAQNDLIDSLITDLEDCLAELRALQDQDLCMDHDISTMEAILDEAEGKTPFTPESPGEEEPDEEPAADDPDDIGGHWAEDFLFGLFDEGIMTGDDDTGLMRPNDPLNRAEAAKLLVLSNDDFVVDSFFDVFFDVTEDDWFWSYVVTAEDQGYFEGYPDGSFGPGNSILRGEAITIILRALGFDIPGYETYSFGDLSGDEWFADSAEKAYQCGLVEGRDGEFEGGETITRAEIAKILWLAFFDGLNESDCADFECPDCDAVWTEAEALSSELDTLNTEVEAIWDQMQELETLRDEFRQMVENAGGMTDADCDGFEVGPGQAWGVAHTFGDVEWCLTAESQITELTDQLSDYWENNDSTHLPTEEELNADMDATTTAYSEKLDEYLEKLAEYDDCLDELADLQAQGYCLDA